MGQVREMIVIMQLALVGVDELCIDPMTGLSLLPLRTLPPSDATSPSILFLILGLILFPLAGGANNGGNPIKGDVYVWNSISDAEVGALPMPPAVPSSSFSIRGLPF